jgi:hypothetical protein
VEDSVVVVVGGTAEAQAPTKPTDTATAAARAIFFRSFIFGLSPFGTFGYFVRQRGAPNRRFHLANGLVQPSLVLTRNFRFALLNMQLLARIRAASCESLPNCSVQSVALHNGPSHLKTFQMESLLKRGDRSGAHHSVSAEAEVFCLGGEPRNSPPEVTYRLLALVAAIFSISKLDLIYDPTLSDIEQRRLVSCSDICVLQRTRLRG